MNGTNHYDGGMRSFEFCGLNYIRYVAVSQENVLLHLTIRTGMPKISRSLLLILLFCRC